MQPEIEEGLRKVHLKLSADLERWDAELREVYHACTVELCFGIACGALLCHKPALSLLVFPVIGAAGGLLSVACLAPRGLKSVLAWRRMQCFARTATEPRAIEFRFRSAGAKAPAAGAPRPWAQGSHADGRAGPAGP